MIPWETDPQTNFRALRKPPAPLPSAHLAAGMGVVAGRLAEVAAAVAKKALPIVGEGLAQTLTLLPGLLLTSVNADADPAKDADWQMYMRNHAHPAIPSPPKPDAVRLAELERALAARTLTAPEEAELIILLAKVKGIQVGDYAGLQAYRAQRQEEVALTAKLKKPSDAHSINTINSKTRFGGGNRNTAKTVALGHVDLDADFAAIQAGNATYDKRTQTFITKSGRVYGFHSDEVASGGTSAIYPIRGNPGDFVNVSQAEFDVLRKMPDNQGLNGPARMELEGKLRAKNAGVTAGTATKLTNLFNSKKR